MYRIFLFLNYLFISNIITSTAQTSFRVGQEVYQTGTIQSIYTYYYEFKDSFKIKIIDSCQIFSTSDSLVNLTTNYLLAESIIKKNVDILNNKKKVIRNETYTNANLEKIINIKYDNKTGMKSVYEEDNKVNGNKYYKIYDYETDKSSGGLIATETSSLNGKIESYTKEYFDKKKVKIKEVKLHSNNKTVMDIVNFFYDANGKLKERTIYFTDFKITKHFPEPQLTTISPKCYLNYPLILTEKVTNKNKIVFLKKFMLKNKENFLKKDCADLLCKYISLNYEISAKKSSDSQNRIIIFSIKEKIN